MQISHFLNPQPDTCLHCRTTNAGPVHHVVFSHYVPAFACTHCTYLRRGPGWLTSGYIRRWLTHLLTIIHPSTNRARRWLTLQMWPTMLSTKPNRPLLVCYKHNSKHLQSSDYDLPFGLTAFRTTWLPVGQAKIHQCTV